MCSQKHHHPLLIGRQPKVMGKKGLLGMAIFKHCLVLFGELKAPFSLFSFGGLSAVLDVGHDFFALIPGLDFFAEARILSGNGYQVNYALHCIQIIGNRVKTIVLL